MTYEVEKNVKEWGDKVSPEIKGRIDSAIERSRKALRGDDMTAIRAAQEELTKVFSEAGQSFYQQQAQDTSSQAPTDGAQAPSDGAQGQAEDVVEADYEIVDDKK
jgi:molecular chaperone DnaK